MAGVVTDEKGLLLIGCLSCGWDLGFWDVGSLTVFRLGFMCWAGSRLLFLMFSVW